MNGAGGAVLAAAIGVLLLLTVQAAGEPQGEAVTAAQRQVEIAQAERDQARAELDAERDQAEAVEATRWRPWRTAAFSILAIAAALAPIAGLVAAGGWAWRRRGLIYPRRRDATLPYRIDALTTSDARQALEHRAVRELAEAQRPVLPETFHYAPHFSSKQGDTTLAEPAALPAVAPPAFTQVPLHVESVVLGHDGHDLVTRPWSDLQSLAIGGLTGSGKTWTAVSLVLQAIHAGHRVALIDPHAANPESLAARLAPVQGALWRVAVNDGEAAAAIAAVDRLITDRAQGADGDLTPVTLVVDEFTRMMRGESAEAAARVLEGVVSEGRKLAIRVVMLGQRWSATRTGGTGDLRDVVPHVLLHRMRRNDARMLSGWAVDELPDCTKLEPGECYLLEGDDVVRVAQPRMSPADVAAFAAQSVGGAVAPQWQDGGGRGGTVDVVPASRPRDAIDPPAARAHADVDPERVIAMYLAGDAVGTIADAIAGPTNRTGQRYRRIRKAIDDIIRDELRRGLGG